MAFNMSATEQSITLPEGNWTRDKWAPFEAQETEHGVTLPPYQAYFAQRAGAGD